MGVLADAFVAYAKPLIDATDGSEEQVSKALTISQLCYNLARLDDELQTSTLQAMMLPLGMDDAELANFRKEIFEPMVARYRAMFPNAGTNPDSQSPQFYEGRFRTRANGNPSSSRIPVAAETSKHASPAARYAPCPCNSGLKYKFCCGKKGRS